MYFLSFRVLKPTKSFSFFFFHSYSLVSSTVLSGALEWLTVGSPSKRSLTKLSVSRSGPPPCFRAASHTPCWFRSHVAPPGSTSILCHYVNATLRRRTSPHVRLTQGLLGTDSLHHGQAGRHKRCCFQNWQGPRRSSGVAQLASQFCKRKCVRYLTGAPAVIQAQQDVLDCFFFLSSVLSWESLLAQRKSLGTTSRNSGRPFRK